MPIPVDTATTPTPVPVPPKAPGQVRPSLLRATPRDVFRVILEPESGDDRLELVPGNGAGLYLLAGAQGLGVPPVQHFTDALSDRDGSTYRGTRYDESRVFLPLYAGAYDWAGLRVLRRRLEDLVDPKLGPTRITVQQPDTGERRTITGYYTSGMEGDYARDQAGWDWQRFGVEFTCPDPWWYGDPVTETWSLTEGGDPFVDDVDLFFPVRLGDSVVAGERTIRNPGNAVAWPVIYVTGPGNDLVVTNTTTGKTVTVSGAIGTGETITIDTRRGVQDVYDDAGDAWDRVALGSTLWSLAPGDNDITVTLENATAASSVGLDFSPAYRSAG